MSSTGLIYDKIVSAMQDNSPYKGWSDIHIQEGEKLGLRSGNMNILNISDDTITKEHLNELLSERFNHLSNDETPGWALYLEENHGDADFDLVIQETRFRCNIHYCNGRKVGLVMRKINNKIPDIKDLGLPPSILKMIDKRSGLILVTGPTGSGKSTTLASMIDYINCRRQEHIITMEDPIEYMFKPESCRITQREIGPGKDSESFAKGLRAALRQDPDIIMVGELRDSVTANMALEAAQTGHLVLATMHTRSASETINRFIELFESSEQNRVRSVLSSAIVGIISQVLIPSMDNGRQMACEIMLNNNAIRNLIREDRIQNINQTIEQHVRDGMVLLNEYLTRLIKEKKIDKEDAYGYSYDLKELQERLK